jgi:phage-related protein
MKLIEFLGDSRKVLREFPKTARRETGYQLRRLQMEIQASDFKPMPSIGKGVEEV